MTLSIEIPALIPAPEPGLYPGTPMADYLAWDCASAGRLTSMMRSPAFCRSQAARAARSSKALKCGSAMHAAILEPDLFRRSFGLYPPGDGRTAEVKRARARFDASGLTPLKPDEWEFCVAAARNVAAHPTASALVTKADHRELSVVADLPISDEPDAPKVRAKVRPDTLIRAAGVVVDLKSSRHAEKAEFPRQVHSLGYYRSAALYLDALRSLGVEANYYVFLAVANDEPYEVWTYSLQLRAIELGREEYRPLLARYHECSPTNVWPGGVPTLIDVDLPAYAYHRTPAV